MMQLNRSGAATQPGDGEPVGESVVDADTAGCVLTMHKSNHNNFPREAER